MEELDPQCEIFMPWDLIYMEWRRNHFNDTIRPRISFNRISLLIDYINIENRICYRIIHRHPSTVKKDAIDLFNTYYDRDEIILSSSLFRVLRL